MPELPEVETTLRGVEPYVLNKTIQGVVVRHHGLRIPIEKNISQKLIGKKITELTRRGKYLLFHLNEGTLVIHLGMSGRLSLLPKSQAPQKHDHVDILIQEKILRFTDPRRFGIFFWTSEPYAHPLLKNLGLEPLTKDFSGEYLYQLSRNKKASIKNFIMNQKNVVGVGNIYANEALFLAKIHPETPASHIPLFIYKKLVKQLKIILNQAIKQGGTTLKDFFNSEGKPGYFSQQLRIYGRAHQPCVTCNTILVGITIGQRPTVFCPRCQIKNE